MLKKKDIDRKLSKYIRQNRARGHSRKAIKDTLVKYGYDENYVEKSIQKQHELNFVKKYTLFAAVLFIAIVLVVNFDLLDSKLTGLVIAEDINSRYIVLDLNLSGGNMSLAVAKSIYVGGIIGDQENTGFLVMISADGKIQYSFYQQFYQGSNTVYIPYNSSISKIEIFDKGYLMLEIDLDDLI